MFNTSSPVQYSFNDFRGTLSLSAFFAKPQALNAGFQTVGHLNGRGQCNLPADAWQQRLCMQLQEAGHQQSTMLGQVQNPEHDSSAHRDLGREADHLKTFNLPVNL
jgi:hypothetical protein